MFKDHDFFLVGCTHFMSLRKICKKNSLFLYTQETKYYTTYGHKMAYIMFL